MVDPSTIFIDGTHIKASANKKKFQKEQVAKAAKVYSGQLRREVNEENAVRMKRGKRYTPHISGRSIWIWLNRYAKRNVRKEIYAQRKETVERVFADAKEKHAMRYTHHRGLAAVTRWVRLKFAAMNLKKLANWSWKNSFFRFIFVQCCQICMKSPASVC